MCLSMEVNTSVERAHMLSHQIACIGGVNIDRKLQTIDPLQYATSNPATTTRTYGGVARNIAENLGRLGLLPVLITAVGDDQEGEEVLRHCVACNVDVGSVLRLRGHSTGTYTAILDSTGEMITALADMRICEQFSVSDLQSRWLLIASSSMIVVDTNLPVETMTYLLERARVDRLALCLVPASRPKLMRLPPQLDGVFLLVINQGEAEALTSVALEDQEDIIHACKVISKRGVRTIIITRGVQGAFWWAEDGRCGSVATEPVSIVDETGAGDAFVSGVIYALQSDASNFERACWFGIRVATLTLQTQRSVSDSIFPQLSQQWLREWEEMKREKDR
jgi:pseudouridine kinase